MVAKVTKSVEGVCSVGCRVSAYGVGKTLENSKTFGARCGNSFEGLQRRRDHSLGEQKMNNMWL